MILAAGRGERLRPVTDHLPKPLIEVGGETLLDRHLDRLASGGVTDVVINVSHLGALIEQHCATPRAGPRLHFSREPDGALETAGGIRHALPLLGDAPFLLVNGDVWTDFDFTDLPHTTDSAHLLLVNNPPHHPEGDFALQGTRVTRPAYRPLTYAGIGLYAPALFADLPKGRAPLAPLLFELESCGRLSGSLHTGRWFDIGTPERLEIARRAVGV